MDRNIVKYNINSRRLNSIAIGRIYRSILNWGYSVKKQEQTIDVIYLHWDKSSASSLTVLYLMRGP